jgi:CheY-like chemotaxis protein/HPt (histidine-containing phosphotransfer) domain-containing protein
MARILVAEDYLFNQLIIQRYLNKLNHNFIICNNGSEALNELKGSNFDIVLMDIEMPIMGGVEAVTYIRSFFTDKNNKIPILALTGHHDDKYFEDLRKVGFDDFILKPIDKELLENKINFYLNILNENKKDANSTTNDELNPDCIINLDYLNEFAQGDKDFIIDMINIFLENAPQFLENLEKGYVENDWEKLRYNAHKFSPQLAFFGLNSIIIDVDKIEEYAVKKLQIDNFNQTISKVIVNCNKAIEHLRILTI